MPELPEVETIRRTLREGTGEFPGILGWEIESVALLWPRTLAKPTPTEFRARLPGQQVLDIWRRGKFLIVTLTAGYLLFHLRMSGDLVLCRSQETVSSYCRLWIEFRERWRLCFNDTRKFGRVWLVTDAQEVLSTLGPEPLGESFTTQKLYEGLQSHHRQLKSLLMDQTFLAGLGNIYSDEALNLAHLHPLTLSHHVTLHQAEHLWRAIRSVLQEGIRRNGASIDWVYRGGDFQNHLRVYKRYGLPCRECGTPIQRIRVSQRYAHFCPRCQPLRSET